MYEGDEVIGMIPISHMSVNTNSETDDLTELIVSMRVVLTRREPGHVYLRTLRHDEVDDGRPVHVEPGESFTLEQVAVELDHIDSSEQPTDSGYAPLTPPLWSWLSIGSGTMCSTATCWPQHVGWTKPTRL
jgi:hypothetical protein